MSSSAKFVSNNRSTGGNDFLYISPYGPNDSNSEKKDEEKKSENNGFSLGSLWKGLLNVRGVNTAAKNLGKEDKLAAVSPTYARDQKFWAGAEAVTNAIFGIDEATAKKHDSAVQGFVDDLIAGEGVSQAVINAASKYTTPQTGVVAKPVIYSDWSPASKLFGMNQETAFSEHMANTAHQREVADLKAAGLNPVLGISGSGSTSVSGSSAGGSSSALKADNNGFLDLLGATAAVITAVATKNPMYGFMVSNIFKSFD